MDRIVVLKSDLFSSNFGSFMIAGSGYLNQKFTRLRIIGFAVRDA